MTDAIIPPRSGTAFRLEKGQVLTVTDVEGVQVADLLACLTHDIAGMLQHFPLVLPQFRSGVPQLLQFAFAFT